MGAARADSLLESMAPNPRSGAPPIPPSARLMADPAQAVERSARWLRSPSRAWRRARSNTLVVQRHPITFPVLLAFGYAPVTANVSNTIGLVRGRSPARSATAASCRDSAGAAAGVDVAPRRHHRRDAAAVLPASAFKAIVPVFITLALVLTVMQPRIAAWLMRREIERRAARLTPLAPLSTSPASTAATSGRPRASAARDPGSRPGAGPAPHERPEERPGGFGQRGRGGLLHLRRPFAWGPAAIIAVASIVGAQLGARYGRRLRRGRCAR